MHIPDKTTPRSDDPEVAKKSGPRDGKAVLRVIDASFDGTATEDRATFTFNDKIAEGMKSLPPHSIDTARILDITVHSDFRIEGIRYAKGPEITQSERDELMGYLQETYTQPLEERRIFRWQSDPLLANDIDSISKQWSQRLGGGKTNLCRLVNRTSLQQHPLDDDVHPRDSYLTCLQDANNRLIVIIVNDVWSNQEFRTDKYPVPIPFKNPRCVSRLLSRTSCTSLSDGTLDTFAKLLVLDFFLTSIYLQRVDYYRRLIYPEVSDTGVVQASLTKNPHLQVPLGLFEPRLSAKSREAFKEIEDAEGILRSVKNLVDSILFVVIDMKQSKKKGSSQSRHKDLKKRLTEVEGLCRERGNNAQRALDALERQLDYLTKRHAISEAKAIKILTILASFYLPLSLSASLLGMQSPFKLIAHNYTPPEDESYKTGTNLLFDFFGVFIGLGTVTIFIVHAIRFIMWLRIQGLSQLAKTLGLGRLSRNFVGEFSVFEYGRRWRFGGGEGKALKYINVFTAWWIGAGMFITLLVIFLVGMLRTAQKAWDTAKIMFATYITVGGLLIVGCIGFYYVLYRRRLRDRQKDPLHM